MYLLRNSNLMLLGYENIYVAKESPKLVYFLDVFTSASI